MISGEYDIKENKIEYGERTVKLELCIVTDESKDNKSFSRFQEELEELLNRYAI